MAFDVQAARRAGYSDAEIADYLGDERGFKVGDARRAGYTDTELVDHLNKLPPPKGFLERAKDTVGDLVDGVMGGNNAVSGAVKAATRQAEPERKPQGFNRPNLGPAPQSRSASNVLGSLGIEPVADQKSAAEQASANLGLDTDLNILATNPNAAARREAANKKTSDALRKELPKYQSVGNALVGGANDLGMLSSSAIEAVGEVTGIDGLAAAGKFGREKFAGNNERNEADDGNRGRFLDIRTVGDALGWAGQTAGNLVPVMVPAAAGSFAGGSAAGALGVSSTIGSMAGAFVPSLALGVGEVQSNMKQKDPNSEADGWVFAGGTAIAALDSVLPGKIGGSLIEKFGREAAEEVALRALLRPATATSIGQIAKAAGREAGKDALIEGLTESVQEAIGEVSAAKAADQNPNWAGLPEQMLEAGAAGAFMGGGVGGVTAGIEGRSDVRASRKARQSYQSGVDLDAITRLDPNGYDPLLNAGFGLDELGRLRMRRSGDTRTPGPGIVESATVSAATLTPEDLASPLNNVDLAAGMAELAKPEAAGQADAALSEAGLPKVGSQVNVAGLPGGGAMAGVIEDVFSDDTGTGVVVRPTDGGKPMREYLDTLNELGVSITPFDPLAEADAIDATLAALASEPVGGSSPLPAAGAETPSLRPSGRTPSTGAGGGVNFDMSRYMARTRGAESSGNDNAKAGTSSATGRYQFTNGTWLGTYREVFGNTGESEAQILAKRTDGAVQDKLMQRLTQSNVNALQKAGLPVDDGTAYLAHFAGVDRAKALLTADPNTPVADVLGAKAVAANPFLKGKTASQVVAWANKKMGGEGVGSMASDSATVPDVPTQWAELPESEPMRSSEAPAPALPEQPVDETGGDMAGPKIDKEWTAFAPDSGSLGIPRAEMPQIKAEHRGAMVNFLNARGIAHEEVNVAASTLKPSQAEFSASKVEKAKGYEGGNRAILISSDGHVVDGHHQWLAARDKGEEVRAIKLDAPIRDVLQAAHEFPSSETAGGATAPAQPVSNAQQLPAARVEETSTGKSVAVIGASEAEMAAISAAVPDAKAMRRKDGAMVYGAKYAKQIRAAIAGVSNPVTPAPAPEAEPAEKITPKPQADDDARRREMGAKAKPATERKPIAVRASGEQDVALTASGSEVPVQYAVVDLADLVASNTSDGGVNPAYPADRQPRDRTRAASQTQINEIASRLNPRLLGRSPKASDGAPIISPDGIVESGNGRTLALQRVYGENGESAQAYRDFIASEGFDVAGVEQPVLVRIRDGNMTPEQVQDFVRAANVRDTAGMSGTEQAAADAAAMPSSMVDLYRGGDIDAAGNRDFVKAFVNALVPTNERASMILADGSIAKQLVARIEAALLVRAFGERPFIEKMVDATDNNVRAIGKALVEMAGKFAKLREAAQDGRVDDAMDITSNIAEAVEIIDRARREGKPVADYVNQRDIFSGTTVAQMTEAALRTFFFARPDFTKPLGQARIVAAMDLYATEAMKAAPEGGLFGESTKATPDGILDLANERRNRNDGDQPDLLSIARQPRDGIDGARDARSSGNVERSTGEGVQARTGDEGGPSSSVAAEVETAAKEAIPETQPIVPAAKIAGNTRQERRFAALQWYNRNLVGTTVTTTEGMKVQFTKRSGDKTTSLKGDRLLSAVPAIAQIIERGTVVSRSPGNKPGIQEVVWISAPVQLPDGVVDIAVMVRRQNNGTYQYAITDKEFAPAQTESDGAQSVPTREGSGAMGLNLFEGVPADKSVSATDVAELSANLQARLESYGIARKVALRIVDTLGGAAGEYRSALMKIATDTAQAETFTLDHEVIHALREMGLFNTSEWAILSAKARRDPGLMRSIRQRYEAGFKRRGMSGAALEEALVEEAVSDLFARYQRGDYKAEGTIARVFKALRQALEAIANFVQQRGARTAQGVMQDVAAGQVGARSATLTGGAVKQSLPDVSANESPAFENEDTEARFQAAKDGVGSGLTLRERMTANMERAWQGLTRHWINLPNEPRFAALQQKLRAMEAAPQTAKERTIRLLDDMVKDFTDADLDLFTRKVILDDLYWDAGNERDLPFGFTRESLMAEAARIDAIVDAQPDKKVLNAVMKRKRLNRVIARDLVDAGVLEAEQIKNPAYYRHQVLEYARAQMKMAHGPGKRLRSPKWAKRLGSSLDINANLLEAEFDWLNKALVDIPVAQTIEWIKKSEHNILDRLRNEARENNRKGVEQRISDAQDIVDDSENYSDEEVAKADELITLSRSFGRNIAMGFGKVRSALEGGEVEFPAQFQSVVDGILNGTTDNQQPPFEFLTWMLDNNAPGSMGAAMILKAVGQRRSWTKDLLGRDYIEPDNAQGLVKQLAPSGYTTWQPDEGKLLFTVKTIPEHVIDNMLAQIDAPAGIDGDALRAALEGTRNALALGGDRYTMILPEEVAATLNQLRREEVETIVTHLVRDPVRLWKRWVLINPRRFIKYNLNNLTGDLDAVIAGNPALLKRVGVAGRELYRVMKLKEKPSARYEEAVERGVFDSGLSVQEIPDIHTMEPFERFAAKPGALNKYTIMPLRKAWAALQGTTQWRENVFRYAAYLDYIERIEAGEPQSSIGYGASRPDMVNAVSDTKDKAALLARDLIGDYGAISHYGGWLRETFLPFWSWTEINSKRYWRLTANAYSQGAGKGIATGGALAVSKGAALSVGLVARMAVLYGALALWNGLFFGDEEDDLTEDQKRQMHLILGRNDEGEVVTLRLQGAMSDALSWFGWRDALAAAKEYELGRRPLSDVVTSVLKTPVNKIATSLSPSISVPIESAMGKKLWPDVFNPRPMDDGWRNLLSTFSLDNEYDAAMNRPSRGYVRSWQEAVIYRRDPGEMAYNASRGIVFDWLEREKGQESSGGFNTPRSAAAKDFRKSRTFGDRDSEEDAWNRMADLGVTTDDLKSMVKRADPLGPIAKKDQQAFVDQLTDEEYQTFLRADAWYRKTFEPELYADTADEE